jgi:hypothetical protein
MRERLLASDVDRVDAPPDDAPPDVPPDVDAPAADAPADCWFASFAPDGVCCCLVIHSSYR